MQKLNVVNSLERVYNILRETVLRYQNPVTGLFPAGVYFNSHEPSMSDAWVRDNCYTVYCVWAVALAYKKHFGPHDSKYVQLKGIVVAVMRSLLLCMMKQAGKVESFKHSLSVKDALHAKYNINTGDTVVSDFGWGHLQIDATSLYLLLLTQFISTDFNIILNIKEASFVQNLVFYIEFAFMIPDYGVWERGDKTNHGMPELNCCSIGMAKAALEALSDFNLFGASNGGASGIIHVDQDSIHKCDTTLLSMLPRESPSKEIGSSVLNVIGFPAFAVYDDEVVSAVESEILQKLEGNYGLKRFLRDGYCTTREDPSRLHYNSSELKMFENIECEWPMFFATLSLTKFFKQSSLLSDSSNNKHVNSNTNVDANKYLDKLEKVLVYNESLDDPDKLYPLVPQLYYVPEHLVTKEVHSPNSQKRLPNQNAPLLTGQSLYIVCLLLRENLIKPSELDPVNRRFNSISHEELTVQVCILANDPDTHKQLTSHNIECHYVDDHVHPMILPSDALNSIYQHLGECPSLKLTGRVYNKMGILSTSLIYRTEHSLYGFYPTVFDSSDNFLYYDPVLFVDVLATEIEYLRVHWRMLGRPTIFLNVSNILNTNKFDETVSFENSKIGEALLQIQSGHFRGVQVKLGRFEDLLHTACITDIRFLSLKKIQSLITIQKRSVNRRKNKREISRKMSIFASNPNELEENEIQNDLQQNMDEVQKRIDSLSKATNKDSFKIFRGMTWGEIRQYASKNNNNINNMGEICATILSRGKQITIGYPDMNESVIEVPSTTEVMLKLINDTFKNDRKSALITQELLYYISFLIKSTPHLFNQMLRIRSGLIIMVMMYEFCKDLHVKNDTGIQLFLNLEPNQMKLLLYLILSGKEFKIVPYITGGKDEANTNINISNLIETNSGSVKNIKIHILTKGENMSSIKEVNNSSGSTKNLNVLNKRTATGGVNKAVLEMLKNEEEVVSSNDQLGLWYRRRSLDGALNKMPKEFPLCVWYVLSHFDTVKVGSQTIKNELVNEMTAGEFKFALRVENCMFEVPDPEYRQFVVEVLMLLASFLQTNQILLSKKNSLLGELCVNSLISIANESFLESQVQIGGDAVSCCAGKKDKGQRKCNGYNYICRFFYDSAPSGVYGTLNYFAQAIMFYFTKVHVVVNAPSACKVN